MSSVVAALAYRYLAWAAPTRCPYPPVSNGQLPKQTPPVSFPILVYSHRGGNLECNAAGQRFVENTLPAFRHSATAGAHLLELDVQLTRDGLAAVFHDRELGRMCGPEFKGKRIADFTYAELPSLLSSEAGQSGGQPSIEEHAEPDAMRIPLLEEVFNAHPDVPIQIDLKFPSEQLVHVVSDLVARHGRERSVLWGSFLHPTNTGLYSANPNVPLFASAPRTFLFLAAHCAGRLSDVHVYESAIILPWRLGVSTWWRPSLLLPDFFRDLNTRGVSVVLYGGINDEAAFAECMAAGANAICTDHPVRLMRWLEARKAAPADQLKAGSGDDGGSK